MVAHEKNVIFIVAISRKKMQPLQIMRHEVNTDVKMEMMAWIVDTAIRTP